MRKILEWSVAVIIMIVLFVFYWYSRNIVSGYYELLWFHNVEYSGAMTKILLIIPVMVYVVAAVMGIVKLIGKRRDR